MQPEPATLQENNTCTVRWQDEKHFTAIVIKIGACSKNSSFTYLQYVLLRTVQLHMHHAGEEEEFEQYYKDHLWPSDHDSSGSTCSTAYNCKDPQILKNNSKKSKKTRIGIA